MNALNSEFLDWFKRRVLIAIASDEELRNRLVLKGGNLLDIVYNVTTRSSHDLDFSVESTIEAEVLRQRVAEALSKTFAENGYLVFDVRVKEVPSEVSADLQGFWGGYQVKFKIISQAKVEHCKHDISALRRNAVALGQEGSTVFGIDISKYEYCAEKQYFENIGLYGYSPEMAIAEKLRAICQQMPAYRALVKKHLAGRARDFVDIETIAETYLINFEQPAFHSTVRQVFNAKKVPLNLISQIGDHREDHRPDFTLVEATVKAGVRLEDFDYYADYVVRRCTELKPLWNE